LRLPGINPENRNGGINENWAVAVNTVIYEREAFLKKRDVI